MGTLQRMIATKTIENPARTMGVTRKRFSLLILTPIGHASFQTRKTRPSLPRRLESVLRMGGKGMKLCQLGDFRTCAHYIWKSGSPYRILLSKKDIWRI